MALVFAIAPIRNFAMASPQNYWAIGIVCACVLLLSAALGYAFIERPGIAFGKRLIQRRIPTVCSPQHAADTEHVA
ncbi:MAG: hypothetical protein Q7J84_04970 [Sulfuricaulis sp.]|nr:hypothetical protein [Sulfuricaulis sp.]